MTCSLPKWQWLNWATALHVRCCVGCGGDVEVLFDLKLCQRVCEQSWWSWEHCQMLLLFVTWHADLYAEHPFALYWLLTDVIVERLARLFCIGMSRVHISAWRCATLTETFCGFLSLPGKFLDSTSY
jgi:hypothetical protein